MCNVPNCKCVTFSSQYYKTNFQNVLDDLKHELATKLLTNTSESISEIVYLTGFSEPSTFYRAFQRWEKMTPLQYRNLNRSNAV